VRQPRTKADGEPFAEIERMKQRPLHPLNGLTHRLCDADCLHLWHDKRRANRPEPQASLCFLETASNHILLRDMTYPTRFRKAIIDTGEHGSIGASRGIIASTIPF
jgi:hypothetical protein